MTTDPLSRLNAALEGRYRIEREIGEGGMATVYLAHDERHNRSVALKVLKPELAAVVGAERFLTEIETTANLQHPHILPLFDSGEAEGFLYFVMPYVEGDTLRDKIDREKQLSVEEAVKITEKVASALDYAHERGVVHRDIKPGNILLSERGEPTVADFGIALAVAQAGGGRVTETGLSIGTPHYMSPEQATGDRDVDPRTDIYALGSVLYEMLTGEPPYQGGTAQAVLARILTDPAPRPTKVRVSIPPNVDAAIRKALEKLPADRFTSAQEFARALGEKDFRHGEDPATVAAGRPAARRVAVLVGVGFVLGVAVMGAWLGTQQDEAVAEVMRFTIEPPESAPLAFAGPLPDLAISPDGRQIVYMGPNPSGSAPQFNLRTIDQLAGAPLRGGENGFGPFFSPDGEWVGFVDYQSQLTLQRVSTLGGPPVTLAESPAPIRGASWGMDDQIYFGTFGAGLFRVSGGGGEPEPLTTPDREQGYEDHRWPSGITGRNAVVFVGATTTSNVPAGSRLLVLDLSTNEIKELGIAGTNPRYVSTGHLVYAAEDGSLRAVPFDAGSLEVTGNPVPLVEGVAVKAGTGAAEFSVSDEGRLIYSLGDASEVDLQTWEFVWVDREGNEDPLPMPARPYLVPRVSPDGRRVATSLIRASGVDLWVYDVATGAGLRLTQDDELNRVPIWAPDGSAVFFSSTRDAPRPASATGTWWGNVYSVPGDGSGPPVRVTTTDESQALTGATPDGRMLTYTRVQSDVWQIMGLSPEGNTDPEELVSGPFRSGSGTIAPSGQWIAYRSDETGDWEIYVEPFPGPGAKVPVSIGGGNEPVWSHDGRELYYRDGNGMMVAATIVGEGTPEVSARTVLFSTEPYKTTVTGAREYHVAPDGRFLMQKGVGEETGDGPVFSPQISVVLNWFEELRERVPN